MSLKIYIDIPTHCASHVRAYGVHLWHLKLRVLNYWLSSKSKISIKYIALFASASTYFMLLSVGHISPRNKNRPNYLQNLLIGIILTRNKISLQYTWINFHLSCFKRQPKIYITLFAWLICKPNYSILLQGLCATDLVYLQCSPRNQLHKIVILLVVNFLSTLKDFTILETC